MTIFVICDRNDKLIKITNICMAEQEIQELKQKLEASQVEFESYKVECKQLQEFLEEEAMKKQEQIKVLKEDAIKKQKIYALSRHEISQLYSEVKNLKNQVKDLQDSKAKTQEVEMKRNQNEEVVDKLKKDLEMQKTVVKIIETQKNQAEEQLNQVSSRLSQQIAELQEQLKQKESQLKDALDEISFLKKPNTESSSKLRNVQITIQRTKRTPVIESDNEFKQLKQLCAAKDSQIALANQKIGKLTHKIKGCERRIVELEQFSSKKESLLIQQTPKRMKQQKLFSSSIGHTDSDNQNHERVSKEVKNQNTISAMILTKKYYISPFMEFEGKNTIKLYKTDKNGRVDKTLGFLKYKTNLITYSQQKLLNQTASNIISHVKNGTKSRVIIYGAQRCYKKALMCELVRKLESELIKLSESKKAKVLISYYQTENTNKNFEIKTLDMEKVCEVLQSIGSLNEEQPRTPKKQQKIQLKAKESQEGNLRYFKFEVDQNLIEIITTSFTNCDIRQNNGLLSALDAIAYSKIFNFDSQIKVNLQIILALNPIVGLYQACKGTLALVHCKGKQTTKSNIFEWKESPSKVHQSRKDVSFNNTGMQSLRLHKLNEQAQFYRAKLGELVVQLKVILNSNYQTSYLKKTPAILTLEKILRFIQSIMNSNQTDNTWSPQIRLQSYEDFDRSP